MLGALHQVDVLFQVGVPRHRHRNTSQKVGRGSVFKVLRGRDHYHHNGSVSLPFPGAPVFGAPVPGNGPSPLWWELQRADRLRGEKDAH